MRKNKAQLQTFAEIKPTYAPHIQRERHGDGETEEGRKREDEKNKDESKKKKSEYTPGIKSDKKTSLPKTFRKLASHTKVIKKINIMKKNNEKPSILFLVNGPIQVSGSVQISGQYGEKHTEETLYLCRCGGSKTKPYCDGSHKSNGFKG